jgi:aminoglycoside phosphotransferase
MHSNFTDYLLKVSKATHYKEVETIQALWSNYGKISRYQLENSTHHTLVVKYIALEQPGEHPRGWNTTNSHDRKVKSYQVESLWYEQWAKFCNDKCRIPQFIGSYAEENKQWIILEDLNPEFPLRKTQVDLAEIKVCLKWLANFHHTFLNHKPIDLWEIGTYWHLATRPDEWNKMEHKALKSKAQQIDNLLNNCQYQTIVHGDAKLANFCFSGDGKKVAAVDFQYVGGGCGMKDVAYFLGSCLSDSACERYEKELLDYYFSELEDAFNTKSNGIDFEALENEWRKMYPIAYTDFTRFLMGWMPSHQKINNYSINMMHSVLSNL